MHIFREKNYVANWLSNYAKIKKIIIFKIIYLL